MQVWATILIKDTDTYLQRKQDKQKSMLVIFANYLVTKGWLFILGTARSVEKHPSMKLRKTWEEPLKKKCKCEEKKTEGKPKKNN